jgi:DNA primase
MIKKKNWVDFKEIKEKVSIEMILNHYDLFSKLKKSGQNYVGCCPIHKGINPKQFTVNLKKNAWFCFGDCERGGNVLDFVSAMEQVDIRQSALLIKNWFLSEEAEPKSKLIKTDSKHKKNASEKLTRKKKDKSKDKPKSENKSEKINKPLGFTLKLEPEHDFFKQKNISKKTVAYFGLGFCPKGIMKNRIAIPIYNALGQLVAYCGRAISEEQANEEGKYRLPPNFLKSEVIYNLHRQEHIDLLIIVESFLSVFRLFQAGFKNVVALMGSSLSEKQEALILKHLKLNGKVLLMFDNDEAGVKAKKNCLERLSPYVFVKVLSYGALKPHRLTENELQNLLNLYS